MKELKDSWFEFLTAFLTIDQKLETIKSQLVSLKRINITKVTSLMALGCKKNTLFKVLNNESPN